MISKRIYRMTMCTAILSAGTGGSARGQRTEVVSEAHAKGIVVLRASFPTRGELHSFAVEMSLDGESFADARVGPLRGLRLADEMVRGAGDSGAETTLVVPVVGRFDFTPQGFLFSGAGVYELRWDIAFYDREVGDLKIEQTVHVRPPREADLDFIASAGDRHFLKEVFGVEPPEGGTTDLLALAFIGELVRHAVDDPGEEGHVPVKLESAAPLMLVANEHSDSSYAPYTAYYAARIYLQELIRLPGLGNLTPAAADHELYRKADEALRFTVERADPFLKPRALCTLAYLRMCAASWHEAESYLARAEESAGGQGNVLACTKKLRGDLVRIRERRNPAPVDDNQ